MLRSQTLFAIASTALLALGLLMPYAAPNQAISVTRHPASGQSYAVAYSLRVPCYGLAALFALFAFFYSIGTIRFSRVLMQWHFWLSLGSVAWLALGWMIFGLVVRGEPVPSRLGIPGTALTLSFLAAIPVFVAAQAWFFVDLVRALIKTRHV
ncbi:MAG: hypothetical protein WAM66_06630 [Acidobacteriaceae bacterium]